jgi:hypothetical protein
MERDPSGALLVTRDVASGSVVWSAPSPVDGDASLMVLPEGTVVAVGSSEVVALRDGDHAPTG